MHHFLAVVFNKKCVTNPKKIKKKLNQEISRFLIIHIGSGQDFIFREGRIFLGYNTQEGSGRISY